MIRPWDVYIHLAWYPIYGRLNRRFNSNSIQTKENENYETTYFTKVRKLLFVSIFCNFLCNYFRGALLANASNPDCIEGFGPQHVCNGKKECIGMRDEQDCGKPNCLMVSYLNFHQGFLSLSMDFPFNF